MPTYLNYVYIFFYFELRSDPDPIFFPDTKKKKFGSSSLNKVGNCVPAVGSLKSSLLSIFFSFRIKVGSAAVLGSDFFSSQEPDPKKKISDPHPRFYVPNVYISCVNANYFTKPFFLTISSCYFLPTLL